MKNTKTKKYKKHKQKQLKEILFILFFICLPVGIIGHSSVLADAEIEKSGSTTILLPKKTEPIKEPVKEPTMKDWVLGEWEKVGQREMADKIISCESKWNMNATNVNTNKTFDFSLYQWNSIHIKSGLLTAECLGSYKCQTQKAIEMWKKLGWKPWVCSRLVK